MSDSSPIRGEGPSVLPTPTTFDPEHDQETLPAEPTGPVVLLLSGEAAPMWAAASALEMCAAWARSGRRIVLADLHFEEPVLHEMIGEDNLEGLVDVFFYGASISRSARPVPGRGFYLIPAGTYTPDAGEVYRHERWSKLVAGFRDSAASLVLFTPARPDVGPLAKWVSEAYVLGPVNAPESMRSLGEAGVSIRAHLLPANVRGDASGESAPARMEPTAPTTRTRPALSPDPDDDAELHLPPPPVRPHRSGRSITFALWLALTVIVLMAIGSVVGRLRPDLLPWLGGERARTAPAEQSDAAPGMMPANPGAESAGQPLPYSVQVSAFNSLPAALQRLAASQEALPDAPVFVSPEEIDGIIYYRVLAGALPDSASARRLAETLVERGLLSPQDAAGSMTRVQATPLAFGLSEYPDEGSARLAADSLLDRNIPAYPILLPPSGQAPRWQLYAGAFRDTAAAEVMRTMLTSAGVSPRLMIRSGIPANESE